jgi:hypothetical protein
MKMFDYFWLDWDAWTNNSMTHFITVNFVDINSNMDVITGNLGTIETKESFLFYFKL